MRLFIRFKLRLLIVGEFVNVPSGIVKVKPPVFPLVPNVRLVPGSVVIVPRDFRMGVSEFWNTKLLGPSEKAPFERARIPLTPDAPLRDTPAALFIVRLLTIDGNPFP